jgi:hypothetical protein
MDLVDSGADWAERDWLRFRSILPKGWDEAARVYGAVRIQKGPLSDPEVLLRTMLGHVAAGNSLRQTAGHARNTALVDVSDVALLDRLRHCGDWFEWIVGSLLEQPLKELPAAPYRLRLMDATSVSKPGSAGTDFRLHVAISLPERTFTQVNLTSVKGGEGLDRFALVPGDLVLADRGYGYAKAIEYARDARAHILARVGVSSLALFGSDDSKIDMLKEARGLNPEENRELDVWVRLPSGRREFGRLCIRALSEADAAKAERRVRRRKSRQQKPRGQRGLEASRYVILFTTLPKEMVSLDEVLAIYRLRWQIELAFKTLKQVAGARQVPHRLEEPGRSWLLAKVICALGLQRLADCGAFPPWQPLRVERGPTAVAPPSNRTALPLTGSSVSASAFAMCQAGHHRKPLGNA